MEENNIISTEMEDSWDDIDLSDISDDANDAWEEENPAEESEGEPDASAEDGADHSDDAKEEEKPAEAETEAKEKEEADQSFTLKYMGEEKVFSREDTIALAQKGMDYDRVKSKLNEANEMVEFVNSLAKEMNLSTADFMTHALAGQIAKRENISMEEAKRRLELDRREKAVSAREAAAQNAQQEQEQRRERVRTELEEFSRAYPEINVKEIPSEVFNIASKTKIGLTAAYAMHMAQQAKAALEAEKQNAENKARSVGSADSAGKRSKADEFEDAWYDGT